MSFAKGPMPARMQSLSARLNMPAGCAASEDLTPALALN